MISTDPDRGRALAEVARCALVVLAVGCSSNGDPADAGAADAPRDVFVALIDGGACVNDHDYAILSSTDVNDELMPCARAVLSSGGDPMSPDFAQRIGECLAASTELSAECAACYGENARCGASSCLGQCLVNPLATACLECRCGITGPENCIQGLVDCSGIPDDACAGVGM